ncbi:TRAP transporter large permease subunit [bacterium]|nr:TRAP transporter large permease subunit [bacterium]
MSEFFPLLMFPALFFGVLTGVPVALVLCLVGFLFALFGVVFFEGFLWSDFGFLPLKIFGTFSNATLLSVPLFIFMGVALEQSRIAEDLLETTERLLTRFRGGLLYGLVIVGGLLAASTGIVGATVVTMGTLSLPSLLKHGYRKEISCGTICAAGTLGQILPPSIVLILLGDMMNVPVADLFAGAVLPGLLLVLLYLCYLVLHFSRSAPSPTDHQAADLSESIGAQPLSLRQISTHLLPPLLLIFLVLGSILGGVASPSEAAGCGASAALLIALLKGRFSLHLVRETARQTTFLTSMVFTLLFGAQIFSTVFRGMNGDEVLLSLLRGFGEETTHLFWAVMLFFFILGFFLDFIEICFIFVPVITPALTGDGSTNSVWLALLIALNLQTSFLTPPFGFSLFYLRGVAPDSISTAAIYRGVIPFIALQGAVFLLVYLFPPLVLWLPALLHP